MNGVLRASSVDCAARASCAAGASLPAKRGCSSRKTFGFGARAPGRTRSEPAPPLQLQSRRHQCSFFDEYRVGPALAELFAETFHQGLPKRFSESSEKASPGHFFIFFRVFRFKQGC